MLEIYLWFNVTVRCMTINLAPVLGGGCQLLSKNWKKEDYMKSVLMVQWACHWRQFIASPIKKWGYVHEGRKAMILLKYKVLDSTLLRRTKTERAADLALPPRTVRF
jgi:DNA repair protein RAD16